MKKLYVLLSFAVLAMCCCEAQEVERYRVNDEYDPYEYYRKNPDLKLYFIYPDGLKKKDSRAAVVFFFGGAWVNGDINAFAMQAKALADHGMIAILADYRVSSRHGTRPDACVEDAKSVIRYLKKHAKKHGIDTTRLCAAGGSAGAHIAAASALVKGFDSYSDDLSISPVPKSLVLFNPVFNNAPAPEGWGYDKVKDFFPQISPAHNIKAGAPPTLIMLGTNDALVPVSTAEAYVAKMIDVGSRCELELYEGAGHGFFHYSPNKTGEYDFYRRTLERMIEFFRSLGYIE